MKICPNCGAQSADNARFCGECGTRLAPHDYISNAESQSQQSFAHHSVQSDYIQQPVHRNYAQQPIQHGYQAASVPKINQYRVGFEAAIKSVFLDHFCDFSGRSSRSEFWWSALVSFGITFILFLFSLILRIYYLYTISYDLYTIGIIFNWLSVFVMLGCLLPMLGVAVRRLHDIGKPGTLLFVVLIPVAGLILLYWLSQDSEPYPNKYGVVPNLVE